MWHCLFDLTLQLAECPVVLEDVGSSLLLVLLDHAVDDAVVEVLATKIGVTSGSQDLKVDGQEGDIDSSSTEITDDDVELVCATGVLLIETVGDGGGGGFVDDMENGESGEGTGSLVADAERR